MSGPLALRVRVQDTWDDVRLALPAETRAGEVKRAALHATRITADPGEYILKFRGAEVSDTATLEESGIVPDANLIVLNRRRRPIMR